MAELWHAMPVQQALDRLGSGPLGLHPREATSRLARYGPNELVQLRRISPLRIFLRQFLDMLVIVLIVAAFISAAIGWIQGTVEELYDAIVIMIIVAFNAGFGFFQEYRAEKAIQALKGLTAPHARVLREGQVMDVPSRDVVPGDVLLLNAGDKVAADVRIFEVATLRVNEAPLTGESTAVTKETDPLPEPASLPDRRNMCYAGCTVEAGRGKGVVVATGMASELGRIAGLVQAQEAEMTPLQRRIARFGKRLGVAIGGICLVVFLVGALRTADVIGMFLVAVSLAVAAIPEGLPAVVTITLALGLTRMARRNALIRKLPAVETLGSATVICSDKTGTLTLGEMNVRTVHADGTDFAVEGAGFSPEGRIVRGGESVGAEDSEVLDRLLTCAMLCNDASLRRGETGWKVQGDSTEGALIVLAMRGGLREEEVERAHPRIAEIPFTSERKMMTTVHAPLDPSRLSSLRIMSRAERDAVLSKLPGRTAYVKGAPERVLERCTHILRDGRVEPLTDEERDDLAAESMDLALRALRVLALAYRELPSDLRLFTEGTVERDLVFLGYAGMMDAPRQDAIRAVAECKKAGIDVVMITGDHKLTALGVAQEMDILRESEVALTGEELDALDPEDFRKEVARVKVYARVSPEHKLKIVQALKDKGHVVAMTGDGVNDAPALKKADLGVSMGITGTEVAKESAEMVLTDDNFASIVRAVNEGRVVYDNIRKFIRYMLSTNGGEVLLIFVAVLLGFPVPLIPIQILWVNLITDGFPALALGVERAEKGVMERKPRQAKESILAGGIGVHIIWVGVLMLVGTLGLYAAFLPASPTEEELHHARTMAFLTISLFQVFHVLAIRVERDSVFTAGFFGNPHLIGAVLLTVALQMLVIFFGPLAAVFETVALPLEEVVLSAVVASSIFFAVETEKAIWRRRERIAVAVPAVPAPEAVA